MREENDIRMFHLLKCARLCFFSQGTPKAFSGDAMARSLSRKVCACVGTGTTIMHNDVKKREMGVCGFWPHHDYPTETLSPVHREILLELPAFTLIF